MSKSGRSKRGWLVALTALLLCPVSQAAIQGPDAGGYSATDASVYSFVNIAGGGGGTSVLAGADDATAVITLPFAFTFYGTSYTQICASSNGAAYFITDPTVCPAINDFANVDLTAAGPPVDLPAILPLWSDLTFDVPGADAVYYQTIGTVGSRRFILQWNNAYPQGSANAVTFQAILTEGTNAVSFEYQTISLGAGNPAAGGAQATIGIRAAGGLGSGQQLAWSFDSSVLSDSAALAFTLGTGPLPVSLVTPANGATGVSVATALSWTASAGATSYDVYLGAVSPPPLVGNTVTTSYSPAGLLAGSSYNWQIVAKNGAGSSPSATWSFTTASPPASGGGTSGPGPTSLSASPTSLTFSSPANGGLLNQTLALTYTTSSQFVSIAFTAVATDGGVGWLNASPTSGTLTLASSAGGVFTYQGTITVAVVPSAVKPGSYTGQVQINGVTGVATVPVTFTKSAKDAIFTAAPSSLSFNYLQGDSKLPAPQNIAITSNPSVAAFTSQVSTNWLSLSSASGSTPAALAVSVNVANLPPGTYSGKVSLFSDGADALDEPVTLTIVSKIAPTVNKGGVVPVYSSSTSIAPGSWISIYGTNLASGTAIWNGDFPTSLDGVSVTVNGKPAYLWYVSPGQINLQAPDDTATGTVNIVVTNENGSFTSTAVLAPTSPSFSVFDDAKHVAAVILTPDGSGSYGGGTYDLAGPSSGVDFKARPAKVGDQVELFGVGFGPTNPPVAAGQLVVKAAPTVNPVTITIGGVPAPVSFSGLTEAGLYQINITVPSVATGDQTVQATVSGLVTQTGLVIAVQ
jgi:uncharacterized protein (TIGR03437 family)